MPDVEANLRQWDQTYGWAEGGDEWSLGWGGPDAEWHCTLRPRLWRLLPAPVILEIAPGYGRWTRYLVECCDRYVGVDLSVQAIDACRQRFADVEHAEFFVNDGRSLTAVADDSIDLAFSFDSLVHVEEDVIGDYLQELARVLAVDGVAFIHHSNLAACNPVVHPLQLALRVAEQLLHRDTPGFDHWRGTTMSAARFEQLTREAGLSCIGQEIVNWLGGRLIDCISLVTRRGSKWDRPNVVVENPYFMAEAASTACASQVYFDRAPQSTPFLGDGSRRHLGSLASITSASVGPWGISVVGPLRRQRTR